MITEQTTEASYFFGVPEEASVNVQEKLGQLIEVENKAVIQVLHVTTSTARPIVINQCDEVSHLLVVVNSGVTVQIHQTIELKEACHSTVELFVADNASVTFTALQNAKAKHVRIRQRSQLGANAHVHWQNITLGGGQTQHDLVSHVTGADSTSSVDWMFYAKGNEYQSLTARNVFDASNGAGEMLMKGVAEQQAHAVCNGMIDIGLQGTGTDTYLTEDVLMLDPTAQVDAVPGLEIKTNDVKASHSATVKRLSPADLFYFNARGIPEVTARHMFVVGFLEAVTDRFAGTDMAEAVHKAVEAKYGVHV